MLVMVMVDVPVVTVTGSAEGCGTFAASPTEVCLSAPFLLFSNSCVCIKQGRGREGRESVLFFQRCPILYQNEVSFIWSVLTL